MTCQELSRLLGEWLSGELPADQVAEIQSHVEECDDCAHLSAGYRTVAGMGRLLRAASVPLDLSRIVEQILSKKSILPNDATEHRLAGEAAEAVEDGAERGVEGEEADDQRPLASGRRP